MWNTACVNSEPGVAALSVWRPTGASRQLVSACATHPIGAQGRRWGSRIRLMQAAVTDAPVRGPPVEPSANSVGRGRTGRKHEIRAEIRAVTTIGERGIAGMVIPACPSPHNRRGRSPN